MISFLHQSVIFWEFDEKNLIAAGVFRINIWFSVPVHEIKFDPPPQGKSEKNLIAAGVVRINTRLSIPVHKIKFDPPPQGKSALVFIF